MPAGKTAGTRKKDEKKKDPETAYGTGSMRDTAEKKIGKLQQDSFGLARQTPEQLVHELKVHQIELETQAEELRRAHLALAESRDRLLDLYDFAPNGYLTLNDKALITDVNLAGALLLGLERRKLVRARFRKFIARQDLESWDRYFVDLLTRGEKKSCTLTLTRADGSAFPARLESIRVTGSNGTHTVRIAINDITDIWQIEALRESEEKFRAIADYTVDWESWFGPDGKYLWVNPAAEQFTGYSVEEILAMPDFISALVAEEDRSVFSRGFKEAVHGKGENFEFRYLHRNGTKRWLSVSWQPIFDKNGNVLGTRASGRDITDRKRVESALRESEEKYRLIADNTADNIWIFDMDFRLKYISPSVVKMRGYSVEEAMALSLDQQMTPASLAAVTKKFSGEMEAEATGTADPRRRVTFETEEYCKDGSTIRVENSVTLLRDRTGRPHGILGISRDITERKRADELQKRHMAELARKNAELDRFTYTVSHDLKSPLMAIRAFMSLLEKDIRSGNAGNIQTDISRMSESVEKIEHLITTLLALSRSGKTVDTFVRIPFGNLARESGNLLDTSLQERGIILEIPDNLPVIYGDRERLVQVMNNLLDNAAKFMGDQKRPRIEVGVFAKAGAPVFFVKDNGLGFKKENLEKAFDLYERFNPEIPGSGIGLATVRRIIEAHGGTAWVESEGEGTGTMVCFTLPGVPIVI